MLCCHCGFQCLQSGIHGVDLNVSFVLLEDAQVLEFDLLKVSERSLLGEVNLLEFTLSGSK